MTNRAAIVAAVKELPIDSDAIDVAFTLNGLEPEAEFSKASAEAYNAILVELYKALLATPDVTEGGYSIRYDRGAIQRRIDSLTVGGEPAVIGQHGIW